MQTSERELMREANETGFRPEIMEKARRPILRMFELSN